MNAQSQDQSQPHESQTRRQSRREFLRGLSFAASGLILSACGPPRGDSAEAVALALGPRATPQTILPSPVPPEPSSPSQATSAPISLAEFLALSSILTGVPNLDPRLGLVYLESIVASPAGESLAELYEGAALDTETPPANAAILTETGILDEEPLSELAATITKLWYTGIYTPPEGEETVATFVDALAWQTLAFTKPMTICAEPGFWSEAWDPVLD